MPKKRPPNAEATEFQTGEQQVEIARQGGIASGIARREKKTVQKILNDFLEAGITQSKPLEQLAIKAGLSTDGSVKDLVTAVCILNTLKKGDVSQLETLARILGEKTETEAQKSDKLDAEIRLLNAKVKLLQGATPDTSLMQALLETIATEKE